MYKNIRLGIIVGLSFLASPVVHAHSDGVHALPLLDGIVHFLTQPNHLVWVILATVIILFSRAARTLRRVSNKKRIRTNRD